MHQDSKPTKKLSIGRRNFLAKGFVGLTALTGIPATSAAMSSSGDSQLELGPSTGERESPGSVAAAASGYDHTCVVRPSSSGDTGNFGTYFPKAPYATEHLEWWDDAVIDYGDTLEFTCKIRSGDEKDVLHWDGNVSDFNILRYEGDIVAYIDGWPVSQ